LNFSGLPAFAWRRTITEGFMDKEKTFTPLEINRIQKVQESRAAFLRKESLGLTGFTLIELLVVIAIIALLMAILMPGLQRVKRQAKTVACQSNLKQWGAIFLMYANENDGSFLSGLLEGSSSGAGKYWWIVPLQSYYHDGKIRLCPTATKPYTQGGRVPFGAWVTNKGHAGSYSPNGWLCNPPVEMNTLHGRTTEDNWRTINLTDAGNIPLFLDCSWDDAWPRQTDEPPEYNGDVIESPNTSEMKRFCINRHDGFVNGGLVDFSVRKIGLKELWKLKWHRGYRINDPSPVWPDWMRRFRDY